MPRHLVLRQDPGRGGPRGGGETPGQRRLEARARRGAGLGLARERRRDARGVGRVEQQVAARPRGADRSRGLALTVPRAFHDERVGDDDPLETQVAAEPLPENRTREGRRRAGRIERGIGDVRRHHAGHARPDRPAVRLPVRLEHLPGRADHRQLGVRIGGRAPVPGEVLGAGHHSRRLAGVDPPGPRPADRIGVRAEGAGLHDGIRAFHVEIHHRRERPGQADVPGLGCRDRCGGDDGVRAEGAEGEGGRERGQPRHLLSHSPLDVGRDQQRVPGRGRELTGERAQGLALAAEDDEATDPEVERQQC